MSTLETVDSGVCQKIKNLPMSIYNQIILPALDNPYTSQLRMYSKETNQTVLIKLIPAGNRIHVLVQEDSLIPVGTIIPSPSPRISSHDYNTILNSLPREMHAGVVTCFVEFSLNIWAKDMYHRLRPRFLDYEDAVYTLSLPCFGRDLGLVEATDNILTTLRAIRCLHPNGKLWTPMGGGKKLYSLLEVSSHCLALRVSV